jgi:hypothetical protein
MLKAAGVDNRIVNGLAGFAIDVATDPLTYVGPAGWGVQAGKAAIRKGGQKAIKAGTKAAATGGLGAVRDDAVKGLIEAGGLTAGRVERLRKAASASGEIPSKIRPDKTVRPAQTVEQIIERRIKGNPTGGRVQSAFARVGGETTSQGGVIGMALEPMTGASQFRRQRIESARKFTEKYGRGTGQAFKIGVPEGQVGSEIAHIPFTDRTLQVPAFTAGAKQANVAQGIYRDKKLGLDLLKDVPLVGAAHQSVQSMRTMLDGLETENAAYAKLADAIQSRIDDGDNTAIDALRDLNANRKIDTEKRLKRLER